MQAKAGMDPYKLKYIIARVALADREELLDRLQRDELAAAEHFALRCSAASEDRALYELFRPLDGRETAHLMAQVFGDADAGLAAVTRAVEDSMEGRTGPRSSESASGSGVEDRTVDHGGSRSWNVEPPA